MDSDKIFKQLVENTNDIILVTDATPYEEGGPLIVYVNAAFEKLTGYSSKEVVGKSPKLLQGPDTDNQTRYKIRKAMREGKAVRTEILNYTKNGKPYWLDINLVPIHDDKGKLIYYAAIERDLTQQKRLQERLENLATTDQLTELANRQHTLNIAEKEFSRARRYSRPLSLVMIDLDHFKSINDKYGHMTGDQILRGMSDILRKQLRDSDLLGRMGGEEFILILPDTILEDAVLAAQRMCDALAAATIKVDNKTHQITASFGVATMTDKHASVDLIIEDADTAMYKAKRGGRNCVKTL